MVNQILELSRKDNIKAWHLTAEGTYVKAEKRDDEPPLRSQQRFIEIARRDAFGVGSYEKTIAEVDTFRKKAKRERRKKR